MFGKSIAGSEGSKTRGRALHHRRRGNTTVFQYKKCHLPNLGFIFLHRGLRAQSKKREHFVGLFRLEEIFIVTTVIISVEDLGRKGISLFRSFLFRNVLVHPQPLFLKHGDINLFKVDPVGLQKAHDGLLMLLYRDRAGRGRDIHSDDHYNPHLPFEKG